MDAIVLDFETRSRVDIRSAGGDNYASDPSTDILCLAVYDLTDDRKWLWYPHQGGLPQDLVDRVGQVGLVMAHNARFDQLIWEYVGVNDYGFPTIPAEKWYCTSAQCRVNALPSSLDHASLFVTGKKMKMGEGKSLIKLLSVPNADGTFNEDPEALRRMGAYCLQDTVATVAVVRATRPMMQREHEDWLISERINDRGVKVDVELAKLCTALAAEEAEDAGNLLLEMTDGCVDAVTKIAALKNWVLPILPNDIVAAYFTKTEEDGTEKITFDKGARQKLLTDADALGLDVPQLVLDVLTIVEEGNKSSVAKFKRMAELADPVDQRVRGAYMYAGASQTKRFSAKGLQVHNFPRNTLDIDRIDEFKDALRRGDSAALGDDSIMNNLSKLLRPAIMPEKGKAFVVGDWSAIEGRVLPWLANSRSADRVLDIFRNDEDIYMHTAKAMGIDDRQIGKVATLALGYQGGVNAFNAMGKAYGLYMADEAAQEIVDKWRGANQWAVRFWKQLDFAATQALKNANEWHGAGRVAYLYEPKLLGGTLFCRLPDDSVIQYPQARLEAQLTPWGEERPAVTYAKAAFVPKADQRQWPRSTLYSGLVCENVTQAVAASILRDSLKVCEDQGLNVVMHVHDEIVLEEALESVHTVKLSLQKIMEKPPSWADGLPLKAEPEVKHRYSK